jgi:hypothetical protein
MEVYSKGSVGPFMTIHYNGYVDASMEGYSKGNLGTFISVHYNG